MEWKKYFIVLILFILLTGKAMAAYKSDIYTAYVTNNMQLWKNVLDKMHTMPNKSRDMLLEMVNYQYGYIGWCIGTKEYADARKYLSQAEKNLEILSKNSSLKSYTEAYRSAFYGYRIGLNSFSAPFIGPKSVEAAKTAMEADSTNPLGFIQYGNSQFYMPPVFGGSKVEALKYYLKALELMEKDKNYLSENWNYLNLLTVIAQAYSYLNDFESSKKYIDKILTVEPNIKWVMDELYPQILKRLNLAN